MPVDPDSLKKLEKMPFEECMKKLEEIVREMEPGNIPLEEMIAHFETGSAIASICHKKLNTLKQKIEMLQPGKTAVATEENSDSLL